MRPSHCSASGSLYRLVMYNVVATHVNVAAIDVFSLAVRLVRDGCQLYPVVIICGLIIMYAGTVYILQLRYQLLTNSDVGKSVQLLELLTQPHSLGVAIT